ncbi:MAG: M48 family metalloprotease [Rhodospirillales bacterium]|nr:M48 family metalloprotease [Rhodospirillales bacterium]
MLVLFDSARHRSQHLRNLMQTVLLAAALIALPGVVAWIVFGPDGLWWAAAMAVLALAVNPSLSPNIVLNLHRAQPLPPDVFPELHGLAAELARRAELPIPPVLYYISSPTPNALTVGTRKHAAIAVTEGMLRILGTRQMAGVMAHEIAHLRHNDLTVLGLAAMLGRLTGILSMVGMVLVAMALPALLMGAVELPWLWLAIMVLAPVAGDLLLLALSRTREFEADARAVALTGDPLGLVSALHAIESRQGDFWFWLFGPLRQPERGRLLNTHPSTEERVRRLLALCRTALPPSIFRSGNIL